MESTILVTGAASRSAVHFIIDGMSQFAIREKIQASMLINRSQGHVFGKCEMSPMIGHTARSQRATK